MDKRKNIMIVIYGNHFGGGASLSAITIGNELSRKGHNVKFLTFYKYSNCYDTEGEELCLDFPVKSNILGRFFQILKKSFYIKKYSKKYNIDTVLSFGEEENTSNVWSKNFFRNKAKTVLSIRSNIDYNNGKLGRFIIRKFYKKADFLVPIVKEEVKNLITNYGVEKNKIQNIYNMFDLKYIQEKSQESLGDYKELFNNGKYTFITVGRLTKQKNHQLLLDAFDIFHQKNQNTQLVVLGEGELREELENQKKNLSSGDNIHFLGTQENPYKFIKKSNVFVFTSAWEGMGRVLVEALECGLCVISTDCKVGPKEVLRRNFENFEMVSDMSIEDYGILVPVDDENGLIKALEKLYNDEGLQKQLRDKSTQRAKDFDIPNIINQWEEVL